MTIGVEILCMANLKILLYSKERRSLTWLQLLFFKETCSLHFIYKNGFSTKWDMEISNGAS